MEIYNINLQDKWFKLVKNGIKKYEVRINIGKHSNLNIGQKVIILNIETEEKICKIISSIDKYSSFKELFESKNKNDITPDIDDPIKEVYYNIPGYKSKEYHGVVCIGLAN